VPSARLGAAPRAALTSTSRHRAALGNPCVPTSPAPTFRRRATLRASHVPVVPMPTSRRRVAPRAPRVPTAPAPTFWLRAALGALRVPAAPSSHVRVGEPMLMGGGVAVGAARGRKPRGTAGVGRLATGSSKPGRISDAGRWGAGGEVPAVLRWVPMVETVGLNLQRKSRSVRLGKAMRGKLSSSKTTCRETIRRFVERSRQ
jgi:hypothetical protein